MRRMLMKHLNRKLKDLHRNKIINQQEQEDKKKAKETDIIQGEEII